MTSAISVPENYPGGVYNIPVRFSKVNAETIVPLVVEYRVVGGSATVGKDFDFANYPLLSKGFLVYKDAGLDFADQPPSFIDVIPINITNDTEIEKSETITIGLFYPSSFIFTNITDITNAMGIVIGQVTNFAVAPTNFNLGPIRFHTITILDDDYATVSVAASASPALEEGQTPAQFIFHRTGPTDKAITAEFGVTGTASPNTDYVPIPRTVTFPAGVDTVTLDVIPIDDSTPEIAETVRVTLSRVVGGQLDAASSTAQILIIDNDGTMEFEQQDFTVAENIGTFKVPVQRYGSTNLTQSVDWVITGGTATLGLDYLSPSNGTLVFLPGELRKTISLVISNDTIVEPIETIQLALTNASGGTPLSGQSVTTVMIESDDTEFRFSTNRYAWSERTNNAPITIERAGPSKGAASVTLIVTNGSGIGGAAATSGLDFRGTNRVINFADGVSNVTFSVRILDDFLVEGDEIVSLSLTNASPGIGLGEKSASSLVILDDDCVIEFVSSTLRVNEFVGDAAINVVRRGGVLNTVAVDFRTADGTATGNVDFFRTNGSLTFLNNRNVIDTNGSGSIVFLPGQSNLTLRIPIFDDQIGEGEETFNVRLSNARVPGGSAVGGSVTLGALTNLLVAIRDDETAGSVDFPVAANIQAAGNVYSLALQLDGRLVFGGEFTEVNGFALPKIARLLPNGDLDTGFNPGVGAEGRVLAVASQPNGRIVIGGAFTDVDGVPRAGLARINQGGDLDTSFDVGTGALGTVRAVALQADGKLIIGGEFLRYASVNRTRLARVLSDGRLDTNFTAVVNATVHTILVQESGKILIGGEFTRVNTLNVQGIVRLNTDGSIDNDFKVGAGIPGIVYSITTQTNGGVIVGGSFTVPGGTAGQANVARFNPDGSLDITFASSGGPNGAVLALGVHSSGKIYAAGEFTSIAGLSRNRIARLRSNGNVDEGFDPGLGANATVRSLAVHPNSEVSIGGDFTKVNDIARGHVARLHGDDRLSVVGVEFAQAIYNVTENGSKATITLQRTGDPKVAFTVSAATSELGSTATAGLDYAPTNVLLTFGAGVKVQSFDVQIVNDTLIEPTETVNLILKDASPGVDLSGVANASISILDDEVSLQIGEAVYSGDENAGSITVKVIRQGLTNDAASVRLTSADGSARAGADYVPVNVIVNFGPGEVVKSIDVGLIDDFYREESETFTLTLSEPSSGVQLGLASSTVTIRDSDVEHIEVVATALASDPNHNGGVDIGEVVTLMVALRNTGTANTTNVNATVVPAVGVVLDAGDPQLQQFGALLVNGAPVSRPFTFGNTASLGSVINLTLQLSDGDRDLGLLVVPVALGAQSKTFSSAGGMNINDDGPANPYPSSIDVAGLPGAVTKLTLTLDGFSHPIPADVDMLLVAPNGSSSVIFSDVGGISGVENLVITLDDASALDLPILQPLSSGTFKPKNNKIDDIFPSPAPAGPYRNSTLDFKGIDPNGRWSLYVVDDSKQRGGSIRNGWRMSIATSGLLVPASDAGVEVTADPSPAFAGQALRYHVRVFNSGPGEAVGLSVTQTLPNDAVFVSATGTPTHPDGLLQWSIARLGVGAEQIFDVVIIPSGAGSLRTQVSVAQSNRDVFASNNSASLVTSIGAEQQVTLKIESSGSDVRISWPASAGNVVLESTGNLVGGGWQAVTADVTTNGGRKQVTLTPNSGPRFYRLRQP